ncbi:MAG: ZIP family metal transporter [Sinimarinibacterium flocculans]|uniref:ZIP family metal transporter n=1 Tax=Sinimarinibacterium flocculans TaxID=985250 RepID=UPI003C3944D9
MSDRLQIGLITLLAGLAMPAGAALASAERIRPRWLENEFRHGVIAFGGGALLAAVALVLVPEGVRGLSTVTVSVCFAAGALAFMALDRALARSGTPMGQLVAMLADFVPEALALGATFVTSRSAGMVLAAIIALQNVPEGFNAYRELSRATHYGSARLIGAFTLMALLGPVFGIAGHFLLSSQPAIVSGIMLFAAGGILYLIFQDIAPQARLKNHWAPPLGAVAGFLAGLLGHLFVHGG